MPKNIEVEDSTSSPKYAKFTAAPFQSGFGHTIGNALRRVLLSSMEGAAISAVKIECVDHEFTSVENIVEDVTEIVLNLKKIRLVFDGQLPDKLEIRCDKAGPITGADIVTGGSVEVLNKDQIICTMDKDGKFRAELELAKGCGWCPAEKNKRPGHSIGWIAIDSLFSPVTRVRYDVKATRVGEETEMDCLVIEIWTDGRISPDNALRNAAEILHDHLAPFIGKEAIQENAISMISEEEKPLFKMLVKDVESLDLSVRSQNCLENAGVKILGELCMMTESKMLKFKNFGKKSLDEIIDKLKCSNLNLGMIFSDQMIAAISVESERVRTTGSKEPEKKED